MYSEIKTGNSGEEIEFIEGEKALFTGIERVNKNIIHIVHTFNQEEPVESILVEKTEEKDTGREAVNEAEYSEDGSLLIRNRLGEVAVKEVEHSLIKKKIYRYQKSETSSFRQKHTANGEVTYLDTIEKESGEEAYEGRLTFEITGEECLYGLGQHEDGIYNYRNRKEYLFQANMKISMPVLLSSRNYGIFIDSESAMTFESEENRVHFTIDTVKYLSYYIITGQNLEEIQKSLRELTGRAPLLPRWAFGYIQSRERYQSAEELLEVVKHFRELGIPLDCIVQDWLTWEDGLWGEKTADKKRYPDITKLIDTLHKQQVKLMVSIWPNMSEGGKNLQEFKEKNLLLPNSSIYNAYDETAREIYWKQCEEEWFRSGVDAWWCDNSEPFTDSDWNGEKKKTEEQRFKLVTEEAKKSIEWTRINSFGLFHAKGIYENWRRSTGAKRVVNLTRSSSISGQKYGTILWSGDISAKWSTLKKQITEGIKISMTGIPYWTLDIGAFFTVKDKWENRGCGSSGNPNKLWFWDGDYNDGGHDLGYRELYVRWFQYGTFLPMFRSHGTDTPREPWNFGSPGEIFYDIIVKYIRLRYQLLPYIYSLAAKVHFDNAVMVRSLMFDFPQDERVKEISDSYLFGRALLICPVTEPMYYGADSQPLKDRPREWEVYLPANALWYDYWTGRSYEGGQTLVAAAELDIIPVFVRSGSILPLSVPGEYAEENGGRISELLVYMGADGEFRLYNDEGDNYSYENGNYSCIPLSYRDEERTLTFGKAEGSLSYQTDFRVRFIEDGKKGEINNIIYEGEEAYVKCK